MGAEILLTSLAAAAAKAAAVAKTAVAAGAALAPEAGAAGTVGEAAGAGIGVKEVVTAGAVLQQGASAAGAPDKYTPGAATNVAGIDSPAEKAAAAEKQAAQQVRANPTQAQTPAQQQKIGQQAAADQTPDVGVNAPKDQKSGLRKFAEGTLASAAGAGAGALASKAISGSPETPNLPSTGAIISDPAAAAARARARERLRAGGSSRASTILSTPLGVTSRANVATRTLLGQ